jgi:hypothetical protein
MLATNWVNEAAKIGIPFRVALPTYTYLVAFDAEGKPKGVAAEGPSARWPAEYRVTRWEAKPDSMATLIQQWKQSHPAMMRGLIWYRLPVSTDSLNWRWTTLASVMQGRPPVSDLRMESSEGQLCDIVCRNYGERDEPLPDEIIASWDDATLVRRTLWQGISS